MIAPPAPPRAQQWLKTSILKQRYQKHVRKQQCWHYVKDISASAVNVVHEQNKLRKCYKRVYHNFYVPYKTAKCNRTPCEFKQRAFPCIFWGVTALLRTLIISQEMQEEPDMHQRAMVRIKPGSLQLHLMRLYCLSTRTPWNNINHSGLCSGLMDISNYFWQYWEEKIDWLHASESDCWLQL